MGFLYFLLMLFLGLMIGGLISGNNTLVVVSVVFIVLDIIIGITIKYNQQKKNDWNTLSFAEKRAEVQKHLGIAKTQIKEDGIDKREDETIQSLEQLATQGDANAQRKLAFNYACGIGVEQSFDKEIYWLKKATEQGDVDAMHSLALRYTLLEDINEAYKWARKSADLGNYDSVMLLRCPEFKEFSNKDISNDRYTDKKYVFGEYSLAGFMKHVEKRIGVADSFFKESLLLVLEIEKISFEKLVLKVKTIGPEYYMFGSKLEISQKHRLHLFFDFFTGYINEIRLSRSSVERFRAFLAQEAIDNRVYNENCPSEGESAVSAVYNGKSPINTKITSDIVPKLVDILMYILEKEKKNAYWLSQNISTYEPAEWYEKYDNFENPSLSDVLEWFMHYCRYEENKI